MGQGQKHWVQAMLNEDTYVPFPYFYDVTAFSGPLLANLHRRVLGSAVGSSAAAATSCGVSGVPPSVSCGGSGGAPRVGLWQISETRTLRRGVRRLAAVVLDRRLSSSPTRIWPRQRTSAPAVSMASTSWWSRTVTGTTPSTALGPAGQEALVDWVDAGGR